MNIDSVLEKIYSLKQFHIKLGLENITKLLNHIGDPQNNINVFHVAGSNGKGSTCSFLSSILQEYGYKVGLYTSPHFVKFNERIRINGVKISDDDIIQFMERNLNYIDKYKPTFFEITTALAFNYFSENKVDYAIIETGLGGRLDATNTVTPVASIITSISLEHSHILGNTLEEIAFEKAGIIKNNVPVFVGELPIEAIQTIENIVGERNSDLIRLSNYVNISQDKFELSLGGNNHLFSNIGLKGQYQLMNAALAIKILYKTIDLKNSNLFQKGLDNVVTNTGIQGRYERYGQNHNIIFDAAHNIEGIEMFLSEFKLEYGDYKNCILIFGAMRDKNIDIMLLMLKPYFSKIYVTSTNYDRAASAVEIKTVAINNQIDVTVLDRPENIIELYQTNNIDDCLVVIGSIYLIGEIKRKLKI